MKSQWITAVVIVMFTIPAPAQTGAPVKPAYRAASSPPALAATPGGDGTTMLWDQSDFGTTAWLDQVFTDFPGSSSFAVSDISTGGATWRVNRVTTYFTQGIDGSWSPAAITQANVQVFPKTGVMPSNSADIAPEYTVPANLIDEGGITWGLEVDTTGIPELACISGDFWIGVTPITSFAGVGQEFHWAVAATSGDPSVVRNPGGSFGIGLDWTGLSALDGTIAGPFELALRLEGDLLDPPGLPWTNFGNALAGTSGDPCCVGAGNLAGGDPVTLTLSNAFPSSTTYLVVGFALLNAPFKGGTMVPDFGAPGFYTPLPTLAGTLVVNTTWPTGVPSGFAMYLQHWIQDPAGPLGFSASNGISGTTP